MTDQTTPLNCVNHELCGNNQVPGMGSNCCMECGYWFKVGGFGWDKLTVIDCDEDCDVCMETCNRKLKFPGKCGHSFCIDCSRKLFFNPEQNYHLSPVPYGCPPCPNGCKNPVRGRQCYCEEYDAIQDAWEVENPAEFALWMVNTERSIDVGEPESVYGKGSCPLCRKIYTRAPSEN